MTKDFEASYFIRADGSLTARYSYRVLNTTTLNYIDQLSPQYVNGLGLIYQTDFNNFGEFIRNIFTRRRRTNVGVAPLPTPTTTPLSGGTPAATPVTPPQPIKKNEDDDN
ncbi:hypothetical protein HK413_08050 [Mucilaginibacter sp. S1162]|uniref:Uncharacterized protein n=1 Tax=Mucilaginibacter humi TaxID=2732510 RepID=A0ABX1W1Q1_9SPHI|nr:hypothetical protein [Mucilaginibacter humi]NNU34108.1 hypothetical protein [Mucilaginibacter humi]